MAAPEASVCYQGVARQSAAFRLMKQMGWEEGQGLGKHKQGIREHVKVRKKDDTLGVGIDKSANNWAFNTTEFDNILKKLKVQVAASGDEESIQKQEVEKPCQNLSTSKAVRPQGRYKKRERGKLVSGYSEKDLKEILGCKEQAAGDSISVNAEAVKNTPNDVLEASTVLIHEDNFLEPIVHSLTLSKQSSEWWGHKHGFVSGGFLGASSKTKRLVVAQENQCKELSGTPASTTKGAFCEEDQENLYNLVQGKATTGKQGLGIGDRPRKIAGTQWKGKKTSFNDDLVPDEDTNVLPIEAKEGRELVVDTCNSASIVSQGTTSLVSNSKFKWKKVSRKILKQAPGQTMKIKLLKMYIQSQSSSFLSEYSSSRDATRTFRKKLESCSKFLVEGKTVSLQ